MTDSVVIVGGGLGASRLAENLRGNEFAAPITIISAEAHPPYDRPPLSKSTLTDAADRVDLKPSEFYTDAGIELRLSSRVVAVDTAARHVTVETGGQRSEVPYGTLVLATGLSPRRFPGEGADLSGVHVIRTFDDAVALREDVDGVRTAVVIGAGFIGCEAAASLTKLGLTVTVVEPAQTPLAGALGPVIGGFVARLHTEAGVNLRTGVGVTRLCGTDGRVSAVELDDGTVLDADLVVVGIGGYPDLTYLEGSGIELADRSTGGGIACDHLGHTSAPGVFAIGDAANWADAHGRRHRVEHWNHTVEQAVTVAAEIEEHALPAPTVPYFWSDQYDLKVQLLGAPRPDDQVHVVDDDGRKFLAYYSRDGLLTGVVGAGRVGKLMKTRPHLLTETPIAELLDAQ
ncbi:NAD(P)/FAD-dependent oxidoreductase [Gordonia phosphorivorans]|uniref:NAD(P)/FAD-dependent oxidoreductase n=1 Tax=Gordonia phosphorivorans TaxID=1056982 RepID=A0ABV6H351_9ACTN